MCFLIMRRRSKAPSHKAFSGAARDERRLRPLDRAQVNRRPQASGFTRL